MANSKINHRVRFFKEKKDLADGYQRDVSTILLSVDAVSIQFINNSFVTNGEDLEAAIALNNKIIAVIHQFNFHYRLLQDAENQQNNPLTERRI